MRNSNNTTSEKNLPGGVLQYQNYNLDYLKQEEKEDLDKIESTSYLYKP